MRTPRGWLGLVIVVAGLVAALFFLRAPIASFFILRALNDAGFENPQISVQHVSLSRLEAKGFSFGSEGRESVNIEDASVTYNWRELISERRVKELRVGAGALRVGLNDDGAIKIDGAPTGAGGGGEAPTLPFERLRIEEIAISAAAPSGDLDGTFSLDLDVEAGGEGALEFTAANFGEGATQFQNLAATLSASFAENGELRAEGAASGDVITRAGRFTDVDLAFRTQGQSWRDVLAGNAGSLLGDASIELRSATLMIDDATPLAAMNTGGGLHLFGAPVSEIAFAGALAARLEGGGVRVMIADVEGLSAMTDTGAALKLRSLAEAPFIVTGENASVGFSYEVTGAAVTGAGEFQANEEDGVWRFRAPAEIGAYAADALAFEQATMLAAGSAAKSGVDATIDLKTDLKSATVGRMTVLDAPLNARFRVLIEPDAKILNVEVDPEACPQIKRARVSIEGQDARARFEGATLCPSEGTLAVINWAQDIQCTVRGDLTAKDAFYQLGETTLRGAPPHIVFDALYTPSENRTDVNGVLKGGDVLINDALSFTRMDGTFDATLEKDIIKGNADIASTRIVTPGETPRIAPIIGTGEASLVDRDVTFSFDLETPRGERLGDGAGRHNVNSGQGKADFEFDRLEFRTDGLQPARVVPALRGIVRDATGATSGAASFSWGGDGVRSAAAFAIENFSFVGPGITVDETVGVDGNVKLKSLWPVASDGVQTLSVARIDMGALQLENGTIKFELPGDETLRVDDATFPWFGGVLGVYGANAAMSGGEAVARLEAREVDLAQMLIYADINGLSGEGILSGVLPLVIEDGKARIEDGRLTSKGPGAIRYEGAASDAASSAGGEAEIAFSILRDLQFDALDITINGPLDGSIDFQMVFSGRGDVPLNNQNVRVPVKYTINLEAALLELLNQANLSQNIEMQIEQAVGAGQAEN